MHKKKGIVIGVGNEFRGDDAAGLFVVRQLKKKKAYDLVESAGEATSLLEFFENYEQVIVVDAICSLGKVPGSILTIDALSSDFEYTPMLSSTHNFGLGEAMKLAKVLGRLPTRLQVIGIEGSTFEMGAPMSACVSKAVEGLALRFDEFI